MKIYPIDVLLFFGGMFLFGGLFYLGGCGHEEGPETEAVVHLNCPDQWPVKRKTKITSGFGIRRHPISKKKGLHTGIDFRVPVGTPVLATASGIVQKAETNQKESSYGLHLILGHDSVYSTLYAHLSQLKVKTGAHVKAGDTIALSGNTGYSKGAHLHYEIIQEGIQIDPKPYLK